MQVYGAPSVVMTVPPGAFSPPPKVHSAVIRIDVAPQPKVDVPLEAFFKNGARGVRESEKVCFGTACRSACTSSRR